MCTRTEDDTRTEGVYVRTCTRTEGVPVCVRTDSSTCRATTSAKKRGAQQQRIGCRTECKESVLENIVAEPLIVIVLSPLSRVSCVSEVSRVGIKSGVVLRLVLTRLFTFVK